MRTEIIDKENKIWKLPAFISNRFVKTYYNQGMVQFDSRDNPVFCGCQVKWLDELQVKTTSQKRADQLMFEYLNKKYPEYKSHIQLF